MRTNSSSRGRARVRRTRGGASNERGRGGESAPEEGDRDLADREPESFLAMPYEEERLTKSNLNDGRLLLDLKSPVSNAMRQSTHFRVKKGDEKCKVKPRGKMRGGGWRWISWTEGRGGGSRPARVRWRRRCGGGPNGSNAATGTSGGFGRGGCRETWRGRDPRPVRSAPAARGPEGPRRTEDKRTALQGGGGRVGDGGYERHRPSTEGLSPREQLLSDL